VCAACACLAAAACMPPRPASTRQLHARAAFDLACPMTALWIYELDERTRGVIGCGQRVTYIEDCSASGRPCTWVVDATVDRYGSPVASGAIPAGPPGRPRVPWPPASNPYAGETGGSGQGTLERPGAAAVPGAKPPTAIMPELRRGDEDLGF
jgi:hypothetical protein